MSEEQATKRSVSIRGGEKIGHSSTNDDSNNSQSATTATAASFGRQETRSVLLVRRFILWFLTLAAIAVSYASFTLVRSYQIGKFELEFESYGNQIINAMESNLHNTLKVMNSVCTSMTSYINVKKNQKQIQAPLLTIPDFHTSMGAASRSLSQTESLLYCPLVTDDVRDDWQVYSHATANDWLQAGYSFDRERRSKEDGLHEHDERRALQPMDAIYSSVYTVSAEITSLRSDSEGRTHELVTAGDGSEYYFPLWQSSPVANPGIVNYDMNSNEEYGSSISKMMESHQAVLGKMIVTGRDPILNSLLSTTAGAVDDDVDTCGSVIHFPVFDQLSLSSTNEANVVGMVMGVLFWESYMKDVLPSNAPPITVVLQHPTGCGKQQEEDDGTTSDKEAEESFTGHVFRVIGSEATYVGSLSSFTSSTSSRTHGNNVRYYSHEHDRKSQFFLNKKYHLDDMYMESDLLFSSSTLHVNGGGTFPGVTLNQDYCSYTVKVYPTDDLFEEHVTNLSLYFVSCVVAMFLLTIGLITWYGWQVDHQHFLIMEHAQHATNIVASMFPEEVRERLFQDKDNDDTTGNGEDDILKKQRKASTLSGKATFNADFQKTKLKNYLNLDTNPEGDGSGGDKNDGPNINITMITSSDRAIADQFEATTILFADIVGFAAWSSQREPTQVFRLLQTLFHSFDSIAAKSKVYKVETVGDCYMAATGLPKPQSDHAIRMAKFAREIMESMSEITKGLELVLGPDTGDLRMRIGMHSGPVAGGVLKGHKTRFQLFGDTVNTASRMESNGAPNKIHCSAQTAQLLVDSGKEDWVKMRSDIVHLKGKGSVATYWVIPRSGPSFVDDCSDVESEMLLNSECDEQLSEISSVDMQSPFWADTKVVHELSIESSRQQRLVEWNVAVLAGYLKQIAAQRIDTERAMQVANQNQRGPFGNMVANATKNHGQNNRNIVDSHVTLRLKEGSSALEEITESINLPRFDERVHSMANKTRPESIELDDLVELELKDYVTTIASMYRNNPFHAFEHASHVTQSTSKLLKRIVLADETDALANANVTAEELHQYSHGLASDTLTQFALVFCALIHDVDHPGVPNFLLAAEGTNLAKFYKNKSIAEQNSVDLAWDLLMDPLYGNLQRAIWRDEHELKRFRQLVVNMILATDIFDKDMIDMREQRWDKAFHQYNDNDGEVVAAAEKYEEEEQKNESTLNLATTNLSQIINLKATVVIEHLIQASDVSHTMQHWDIYKKWNERLFREMYQAYEQGRSQKDPSKAWIEGEVWFFDKYIIPLAKKLAECGVFGVASDEYLNYALENRKKLTTSWTRDGDLLVEEYLERYKLSKTMKHQHHQPAAGAAKQSNLLQIEE